VCTPCRKASRADAASSNALRLVGSGMAVCTAARSWGALRAVRGPQYATLHASAPGIPKKAAAYTQLLLLYKQYYAKKDSSDVSIGC